MVTSSEYYQKNKEKILQQTKQYYLDHKEECLEYQRKHRLKNRVKLSTRDRNKRHLRLSKAIELLGGCCSKCKQQFDPCVYDFHHVNPIEKEFNIGENMLVSEIRFYSEVSKCILLCANCHRLEHKKDNNATE